MKIPKFRHFSKPTYLNPLLLTPNPNPDFFYNLIDYNFSWQRFWQFPIRDLLRLTITNHHKKLIAPTLSGIIRD